MIKFIKNMIPDFSRWVFDTRKMRKEFDKRGHHLWWKFNNDVWQNIFVLSNGMWFVAVGEVRTEFYMNEFWIEFRCDNSDNPLEEDLFLKGLDPKKNLQRRFGRRFIVNASQIVSVTEFES